MNPFSWLASAIKAVIQWWTHSLQAIGDAVIAAAAEGLVWAFPDLLEVLAPWEEHLAWANHFFPLTETLALATTFFAFWCLLAAARLVKRLIPGLSG